MRRRGFLKLGISSGILLGSGCQTKEESSRKSTPTERNGKSDDRKSGGNTDRYIIDNQEISNEIREQIEVVHDLSQIDILVGYTSSEVLDGISSVRDGDSSFASASENSIINTGMAPEQDLYGLQWDRQSQRIRDCHEVSRGGGVKVGVVGSGIINNHPDLKHALDVKESTNVTENEGDHTPIGPRTHGTHIAGIIAASSDGEGVVGIAPETKVVDYRIDSAYGTLTGDLLAGLMHSILDGCDVINLSKNRGSYSPDHDNGFLLKAFKRVASYAESEGTIIVCSAGNNGARISATNPPYTLPTNIPQFVTVSATAPKGYGWPVQSNPKYFGEYPVSRNASLAKDPTTPTSYTNFGENVLSVSAPGGRLNEDIISSNSQAFYDGILSTTFSSEDGMFEQTPDYGWAQGTSYAAPQVTGAIALLKSSSPELSPAEIRTRLRSTATPLSPIDYRGAGHLDILSLLGKSNIHN